MRGRKATFGAFRANSHRLERTSRPLQPDTDTSRAIHRYRGSGPRDGEIVFLTMPEGSLRRDWLSYAWTTKCHVAGVSPFTMWVQRNTCPHVTVRSVAAQSAPWSGIRLARVNRSGSVPQRTRNPARSLRQAPSVRALGASQDNLASPVATRGGAPTGSSGNRVGTPASSGVSVTSGSGAQLANTANDSPIAIARQDRPSSASSNDHLAAP